MDFQLAEKIFKENGLDYSKKLHEKLEIYRKLMPKNQFVSEYLGQFVDDYGSVFDLSKALVSGTAQQAFGILNDLLAQKEKPVVILGTLISAYVDMYRAQVALSSGEAADAAAKVFNYKRREFRLKNGARSSANMSLEQIRNCLDILADADMRLKSTALDERRILEELMLRLMLIS